MPYDLSLYRLTEEEKQELASAELALEDLTKRKVPLVRAADHEGLASFALESLHQVWLGRSLELMEGIQTEWNGRRLVNAVILLRSLMETIALLCNVVGKGRDLLPKEDLRAFHKCLTTAMFGAKLQYPNSELPQATNVLTLISKLEKSFQGSERFYLSLCEVAHPNVDGLMFFGDVREAKFELATTTLEENVDFFVRRLAAGAVMTGVAAFWSIRCDREIKPAVIALEKKHGPHPSNWPA